jgi:predicted permease
MSATPDIANHRRQQKLEVHSYRIEGTSAMRLFVAAVMVVATFFLAALLVSRLFPYGAGWAGLCVVITCLYASAFGAWALFGNKPVENAGAIQSKIARRHLLRDNLLYFAVAMVAVTITIAVLINDTEKGIHRSFKNDWFVGFGSACVALGYAAKAFWISRRDWRLWTIIAALFALFTAITIPVLSQMEKVPLLFMGPLANVELPIAFAVLDWLIVKQSRRFTS